MKQYNLARGTTPLMTGTLMGKNGLAQPTPAGTTITFSYRAPDGTLVINAAAVTVVDTNGRFSYRWTALQSALAGTGEGWLDVTFADGNTDRWPNNGHFPVIVY